jgi:hypothetical protein
MAASLDQIQNILERIQTDIASFLNRSQVTASQIIVVNGVSDISERMGLFQAGEFRAGNSVEPGLGFSGVRMGYPAFTYNSELWNLVGVNDDVLQFGLNAADGKAYFAGGTSVIDSDGIHLRSEAFPSVNVLDWISDDDGTQTGLLLGWYVDGAASGVYQIGRGRSAGHDGVSGLVAMTHDQTIGQYKALFQIDTDGEAALDLRSGTLTGANQQALVIQAQPAITAVDNTLLYLDTYITGAPAAGLGSSLTLRAENSNNEMTTIGIISAVYTDVTDGSEDSKILAWYMVNGVITSKQLAP